MDAASARFTGAAAERIAELLARCTFPPPGTAVTCAVSGGADSTALALLAVEAGCVVAIAHREHLYVYLVCNKLNQYYSECQQSMNAHLFQIFFDLFLMI